MNSIKANRLMFASTGSGKGKTTITSSILYLLKEKGLNISAFKCGPDYIDPMYHESVLGIKSSNLDPFFCDASLLKATFANASSEYNIIESCMGLYDGMGASRRFSSYDVATCLETPIILIIDAFGMGYSIVAQIMGFLSLDKDNLIQGIILNRISSNYYEKIKPVIENECKIKVLGFVPKQDSFFESRHLGLKSTAENDASRVIMEIADNIKENLDINAILDLSTCASTLKFRKNLQDYAHSNKPIKIALAFDEAFNFYYKDNIKLLEYLGAEIIRFSPIHDKKLPNDISGLYIGGGYPENFAFELSQNETMLKSIHHAILGGLNTYAECGGFMYLHESIENAKMVGIYEGDAFKTKGLVRFGYVSGSCDKMLIKGHEFHHYDVSDPGAFVTMTRVSDNFTYGAFKKVCNCVAGFPHLYFFSCPEFIEKIFFT